MWSGFISLECIVRFIPTRGGTLSCYFCSSSAPCTRLLHPIRLLIIQLAMDSVNSLTVLCIICCAHCPQLERGIWPAAYPKYYSVITAPLISPLKSHHILLCLSVDILLGRVSEPAEGRICDWMLEHQARLKVAFERAARR